MPLFSKVTKECPLSIPVVSSGCLLGRLWTPLRKIFRVALPDPFWSCSSGVVLLELLFWTCSSETSSRVALLRKLSDYSLRTSRIDSAESAGSALRSLEVQVLRGAFDRNLPVPSNLRSPLRAGAPPLHLHRYSRPVANSLDLPSLTASHLVSTSLASLTRSRLARSRQEEALVRPGLAEVSGISRALLVSGRLTLKQLVE